MEEQRAIIAMKGAPFTRKTEIATFIATSLGCPLLSLENLLDAMDPNLLHFFPDLAFNIICHITESHLSKKVCDNIVIDSPLASRSQLDQLMELIESHNNIRVVIIECKPESIYSWRMEFEKYIVQNPHWTRKWYKAKDWNDVEKAIQDDYNDTLSYGSKVSKLILDPIWDHLPKSRPRLFRSDFIQELERKPKALPLIEAIKYMIKRKEGVEPAVIVYSQWRNSRDRHCRDHGHAITRYTELGFDESEVVNCMACGKQIENAAYTCSYCSLALHKDCAESYNKSTKWRDVKPITSIKQPSYYFPEVYPCTTCKEEQQPFSEDCKLCLFETHLKCRKMPTVIRHPCDKHFLSIELLLEDEANNNQEGYKCLACGNFVSEMFYSCKTCSVYYHFTCLTKIRLRKKDEHGGHHHRMQLKFSSKEAEDYICDECLEKRDPQLWFYSCQDCKFEIHLDCFFQKNQKPPDWGTSCIVSAHSPDPSPNYGTLICISMAIFYILLLSYRYIVLRYVLCFVFAYCILSRKN